MTFIKLIPIPFPFALFMSACVLVGVFGWGDKLNGISFTNLNSPTSFVPPKSGPSKDKENYVSQCLLTTLRKKIFPLDVRQLQKECKEQPINFI